MIVLCLLMMKVLKMTWKAQIIEGPGDYAWVKGPAVIHDERAETIAVMSSAHHRDLKDALKTAKLMAASKELLTLVQDAQELLNFSTNVDECLWVVKANDLLRKLCD